MLWFVYTVVALVVCLFIFGDSTEDFETYEVELGLRDPDTWEYV